MLLLSVPKQTLCWRHLCIPISPNPLATFFENDSEYNITLTPPSPPATMSVPTQVHASLADPSQPPVLKRRDRHLAGPTVSVQPTHSVQHRTFTVPYNTRGHCGLQGCVRCNREPCGTCQNCIHKKEKRLGNYSNKLYECICKDYQHLVGSVVWCVYIRSFLKRI